MDYTKTQANVPYLTLFEEQDGSTNYSICKGVFYIPDLKAKMSAFCFFKYPL